MIFSFRTVDVRLAERAYAIRIGANILEHLPIWLAESVPRSRHAVLIADHNVFSTWSEKIEKSLGLQGYRITHLSVPAGEASKSVRMAERLWEMMLTDRADRGSVVLAAGGGVVGDLAGFVAATFARGLPLVQIPTTLLSQVDSSVGGKTGINLPTAKNIVGCFWQPSLVVIDTATLSTLPRREFVSGLAEVVKYGMIMQPDLIDYLEEHALAILAQDSSALTEIISRSCQAKASVVELDERETTGLRAILNYGHTFAHALESAQGYGTLLHGEAVSIGMHLAAKLACRMGRIDAELVQRQQNLLEKFELPTQLPAADPEELWRLMQHDKKVEHGRLRFVLPSRMGHVELVPDVPKEMVLSVMSDR